MTESTDAPVSPAAEKPVAAEENGENGENGTAETTPAAEEPQDKGCDKDKDKDKEDPPKEMRAIVLTGFGGLKSVKIQKKPEPTPAEGEVLIRVKAWWVPTYGLCTLMIPNNN